MKNSVTLKVKEILRKKKTPTDITFKNRCVLFSHIFFFVKINLELEVMEVVVCFLGYFVKKETNQK